jgi:uncharacterized protein YbjQ (UPF0145 family)
MIITTTNSIDGKEIASYIGLVHGDAIVGAHIFKDIFAGLRDFFGGRSRAYEKTLSEAREEALKDLEAQAILQGAHAVIGIDFEYQVMGAKGSMIAVAVTGTAVKLR